VNDVRGVQISATVVGSPAPQRLATFYQELLGWERLDDEPGWVRLQPATGGTGLSFQYEAEYRAPQWPGAVGSQQMMMHLDIEAADLVQAVRRAVELGATVAAHQPQAHVRVMLDPDGHPFCLFQEGG